jgi:hypothetical protein
MILDDINILQIDATIIAGLLILLTLLSFKPSKLEEGEKAITVPEISPPKPPTLSESEYSNLKLEIQNEMMDWIRRVAEVELKYKTETSKAENRSRNLIAIMTVGGISVFCASAILIIFFGYTQYGKYAMGIGFIFLIIAVILLVTVYVRMTFASSEAQRSLDTKPAGNLEQSEVG